MSCACAIKLIGLFPPQQNAGNYIDIHGNVHVYNTIAYTSRKRRKATHTNNTHVSHEHACSCTPVHVHCIHEKKHCGAGQASDPQVEAVLSC